MNIRYYHEFIGADDMLNRFEILTKSNVQSILAEASAEPFSIEYINAKKFEPVRGSQATIEFISEAIFQFVDLHTDDMQKFLVKFYRAGRMYWLGWLDSELYNEQLSATPPYPVEFAASDFNIFERLKYRDGAGNRYTDIVPLITHLKRCFDLLGLPFDKLYIGCSTVANDVPADAGETALHVLYMMSANFYDEDNEPMTCREVVENILRPFGLMMVQKDANVFIYDYNTVKLGLPMKRYNFSSFAYEAEETVNFDLGALAEIGFRSTDSSYGFEEMINNVKITSSIYADKLVVKGEATEKNLSKRIAKEETEVLRKEIFTKCETIERVGTQNFVVYTDKDSDNTIIGASSPYDHFKNYNKILYRVKSPINIISTDSKKNNILLKMTCYVNSLENPFEFEPKRDSDAELCQIAGNLYTVDGNGTPLYYFRNVLTKKPEWKKYSSDFPKGAIRLNFCNQIVKGSNIYNTQLINSNTMHDTGTAFDEIKPKDYGKGLLIPINSNIYGQIVFEIIGAIVHKRLPMDHSDDLFSPNEGKNVKDIIYNNIEIKIVDEKKEDISTDDYIFKSHVNKKVATDFDEVTLKCISANEEKAPIGKANILKKVDNHYELQLSFTRSSQTDILERLLMCSLHSNFATKKEVITVDIKMTENPALSYVSYRPILSDDYLVTGCKLNFARAISTLTASGFSADDARISDIPYD